MYPTGVGQADEVTAHSRVEGIFRPSTVHPDESQHGIGKIADNTNWPERDALDSQHVSQSYDVMSKVPNVPYPDGSFTR